MQLLRNIEQQAPRIPVDLNLSANCRRLLAGLLKRNPVERISFEEFFAHPWLAAAAAPAASPGAPDTALEPSAGSGISQHTTPTGGLLSQLCTASWDAALIVPVSWQSACWRHRSCLCPCFSCQRPFNLPCSRVDF